MEKNIQQPQSEGINYELNELNLKLESLEGMINILHSKIEPALMPLSPTESNGKETGLMPSVSTIEEELIISTSKVRRMTSYVSMLIDRVRI